MSTRKLKRGEILTHRLGFKYIFIRKEDDGTYAVVRLDSEGMPIALDKILPDEFESVSDEINMGNIDITL